MINKEEFLNDVKLAAEQKVVTQNELIAAYKEGEGEVAKPALKEAKTWARTLSLVGGGIVFLGIALLVSQSWNVLTPLEKIIVTLGSGIIFYISGIFCEYDERVRMFSNNFFLLAVLLIPLGIAVTFNVAGLNPSASLYCKISLISFIVFLSSWMLFKKEIFLLFSILYFTGFYYSVLALINPSPENDFYFYCTILAGVGYVFLGNYFEQYTQITWTGFLYCIGVFWFLGALFGLALLHQGSVWQWVFPLIDLLVMYVSVRIKSVSFLTCSILFLMAYILMISDRYFSMSMGWPLVLVVMGFMFMAIGYFYFQMKKKYFK